MGGMNEKRLYNLLGLSRQLGLPVSWLKAEARAGNIPCLHISKRKMLFDLKAVERTLAVRAGKGEQADGC